MATGDVISSFAAPGTGATGLAHDGTNLWHCDFNSDLIYKLDPADGTVLDSFASPGGVPTGLAHDGTNLWHADTVSDTIYKLDPADGTVLDSFASPAAGPQGLAHDGTNLWHADDVSDLIYKLDPADGTVLDSFAAPSATPSGLAWDGASLWVGDNSGDLIYKLDPADGTVLDSFAAPSSQPRGLAWNGTDLWHADTNTALIYKLVGNTAPSAPSLQQPPDGATRDLDGTPTFEARYNDPDGGDEISAFYLRRKTGAGAYEYWNVGTATWGAEVANPDTGVFEGQIWDYTFPAAAWTNGGTVWNWSVAFEDKAGVKGAYATDFTVTGSEQPTVTVTGPADPVTDSSRPPTTWDYFHEDGEPQSHYDVKIFTQAQYEAVGFDPATSTPFVGSGVTASGATSWTPTADLTNDTTFRSYVRLAHSDGQVWSNWDHIQYTMDLAAPAAPIVTVTGEPNAARVRLDVDGQHDDIAFPDVTYRIQRSIDGGEWEPVRDAQALVPDAVLAAVAFDYEPPSGVPCEWRAIADAPAVAAGDVVDSFASPGSSPNGLTHDGTNLWNSDPASDTIYKLDPSDGGVISSFASPSIEPRDLTWDGTNLWNADFNADLIYKIDPADGTVISSFAAPSTSPHGLAWDGTNLWNADFNADLIYKIDPADGTVISSFAAPATTPTGLTHDGTNLWNADSGNGTIYKIDPADGTVISSFAAPSTSPQGLTWDGTHLLSTDGGTDTIYKLVTVDRGAVSSSPSTAAAGSLHLTADWLVNIANPTGNTSIRIRDWGFVEQPAEQGVFDPLGSSTAIVVDGVRQAKRGELLINLPDRAARDAVDALLDPPKDLLLQVAADTTGGEGEQYWIRPVYPISYTRNPVPRRTPRRWLTVGWVVIAAPPVT